MATNCDICSTKCFGFDNNHGGCCSVYSGNWILGGVKDHEEFLENLSKKFGRKIEKETVFIEYEEGKNLYPNDTTWQNPNNYPALRINQDDPAKYCIFYNKQLRACSVYEIRPNMCQKYECDYLKQNG